MTERQADSPQTDWNALLAEGELDPGLLRADRAVYRPAVWCDERIAWIGTYPEQPDGEIHVEAAAAMGRPVHFKVHHAWEVDDAAHLGHVSGGDWVIGWGAMLAMFAVLLPCAYVAWRNYAAGRGDRRGAMRFAIYTFCVLLVADVALTHHVSGADEALLMLTAMSENVFMAVLMFLFYIAVEPFARRHWPQSLVSWSRLISGRLRDPLVGRDLLLGCVGGVGVVLVRMLCAAIPEWTGARPPAALGHGQLGTLLNMRHAVGEAAICCGFVPILGAAFYAAALLVRVLLRRAWIAYAAVWLVCGMIATRAFSIHPAMWLPALLVPAVGLLLLTRTGLLGMLAMVASAALVESFPSTLDFSAWYVGVGMVGPVAVLLLTLYGARTSRRGLAHSTGALRQHLSP